MDANDAQSHNENDREWDPVLVELYRTEYQHMLRVARRLLDTDSLAEEAVQDAFVSYQTARNKPAAGKELAYLTSIVLNTTRSMLRRRQTAQAWRPESPTGDPSTESEWLRRSEADTVRLALTRLPDRQRQVLMCRHFVGLSELETANTLAISVGSVKTHSSRGRQTLRGMIGAA
jgi:RNA polymerase sigma factor (sigma-70 family)